MKYAAVVARFRCCDCSGHVEHDDASYVTEEIKREQFESDCLKVEEQTSLI